MKEQVQTEVETHPPAETQVESKFKFNQDGSINWRAMVKSEYLYPNKEWFELRGKPIPDSADGLADNQLLIKLGGLKELAKLRGYNQVSYEVIKCDRDYVVVKCKIHWKALRDAAPSMVILEDPCAFEDMANATLENTNDFCAKFLETIATNRAFVRCVRNYLGINIVGDDEIDKSKNNKIVSNFKKEETIEIADISPQALLSAHVNKTLGINTFEDFLDHLRQMWKDKTYQNEDIVNWKSYSSIPAKECRKLIFLIKQ